MMLALAPPIQSHSPAHSTVVGNNLKAPSTRSKPLTRRAPSSTATSSNSFLSSSSSSSSSSSASTAVKQAVSRSSSVVAPQTRSESTHASKRDPIPVPEPSSSKLTQRQHTHETSKAKVDTVTESASKPSVGQQPASSSPIDINTYPTQDLLHLLAALLNKIATSNDGLPQPLALDVSSSSLSLISHPTDREPLWSTLTTASRTSLSTPTSPLTFHARNVPTISLESYLLRILRYCPTTNEVFLSLIVYFDRMARLSEAVTGTKFAIDSYNVHRLVIAGVTVASKFFSDVFYTNSRYAKVGGLPQAELNQLELQFLLLNDFRLGISSEEMQRYAEQLVAFSENDQIDVSGQFVATAHDTPSSASQSESAPSRPLQSMGAIDAYGGAVAVSGNLGAEQSSAPVHHEHAPHEEEDLPSTPRRRAAAAAATPTATAADESFERDSSCGASVYSVETDTDDEPTIRPSHSSCTSETQSLYSNDASEDGDAREQLEEEDIADRLMRSRPTHRRWDSNSSMDVAERHMASP